VPRRAVRVVLGTGAWESAWRDEGERIRKLAKGDMLPDVSWAVSFEPFLAGALGARRGPPIACTLRVLVSRPHCGRSASVAVIKVPTRVTEPAWPAVEAGTPMLRAALPALLARRGHGDGGLSRWRRARK
jgi:hypothetical protein